MQLLALILAREQCLGRQQLDEDTAHGPHISCSCVGGAAQQDLGRSIPHGHDTVGQPLLPVIGLTFHIVSKLRARPKSASLRHPSLLTNKLAPLMSRCMMALECRYAKPSSSCFMRHLTSAYENLTPLSIIPLRSCSMKSNTKYTSGFTRCGFLATNECAYAC